MNDLVFTIIKAVVYVLFAVIARYMIPWIMTKAKSSKYELLSLIVEDAVRAFEQTITGQGEGAKRKELVKEYVIRMCDEYHIPVYTEQLDALIESAVEAINTERGLLK